jgi:hypothetical protein
VDRAARVVCKGWRVWMFLRSNQYIQLYPLSPHHMVKISATQSMHIFGWRNLRPILVWDDVLRHKLTLDSLIGLGLRPSELVLLQPDPAQWVAHAGAKLVHARLMMLWPANPFTHLGADLADTLTHKFTASELVRMDVTYAQMLRVGMTERTERMFRFDAEEWAMLGKAAGLTTHSTPSPCATQTKSKSGNGFCAP